MLGWHYIPVYTAGGRGWGVQIPPVLTRADRDLEQPKRLLPQSGESAASANTNYLTWLFWRTLGQILTTVLKPYLPNSGKATTKKNLFINSLFYQPWQCATTKVKKPGTLQDCERVSRVTNVPLGESLQAFWSSQQACTQPSHLHCWQIKLKSLKFLWSRLLNPSAGMLVQKALGLCTSNVKKKKKKDK